MLRWLCWWRPPSLLKRVIVNLQHDGTEALEGILWSSRGAWLILRDVSALKASLPPMKIPGEAHVPRANVAYLQVLP